MDYMKRMISTDINQGRFIPERTLVCPSCRKASEYITTLKELPPEIEELDLHSPVST
jgi:hypothetical protein